jgi:hypothetical protein
MRIHAQLQITGVRTSPHRSRACSRDSVAPVTSVRPTPTTAGDTTVHSHSSLPGAILPRCRPCPPYRCPRRTSAKIAPLALPDLPVTQLVYATAAAAVICRHRRQPAPHATQPAPILYGHERAEGHSEVADHGVQATQPGRC